MIAIPDIFAAGFFVMEDFMAEVCATICADDLIAEWATIPEAFGFFAALGEFEWISSQVSSSMIAGWEFWI